MCTLINNTKSTTNVNLILSFLIFFVSMLGCTNSRKNEASSLHAPQTKIRGWNILSSDFKMGMKAIAATEVYQINHLQLSHDLIMDLKDVRNADRLSKTRMLTDSAHAQGVEKVFVWDHALYNLDYYPDRFKTDENKINLDNPEFWQWFKSDYRSMLDSLKQIDGIILTFIETGAHIEDQYSEKWQSESEKLANLVDSVASVVIDERKMDLFIRTFIYHQRELDALLDCIDQVQHPDVKVMTKEAPHDFFLTHPVSSFVKDVPRPVLIEFDLTHEYNGQGIIASVLPEKTIERWKYYATLPNVIGYVARTDRYGTTQTVGRPTEMNLYALKNISEDTTKEAENIVASFIEKKYGLDAVPYLKEVFLESDDIILSVFYTMGLHCNNHSRLDFEHEASYSRHCSAKWLDSSIIHLDHDINRSFHYWNDIVDHLAPAKFKMKYIDGEQKSILYEETPHLLSNGEVKPGENMNAEYLNYIVTEKEYGVKKAKWALEEVKKAKELIANETDYDTLLHVYQRTYLTAKLYLAASKVYFGGRCLSKKPDNKKVKLIFEEGLDQLLKIANEMEQYPFKGVKGQYNWSYDISRAKELHSKMKSKY